MTCQPNVHAIIIVVLAAFSVVRVASLSLKEGPEADINDGWVSVTQADTGEADTGVSLSEGTVQIAEDLTLGEDLTAQIGEETRNTMPDKKTIFRDAAAKICDTFPGNVCESLIKGAHLNELRLGDGTTHGANSQIKAALRRRMDSGESFVFAAFGSSLTAGHYNHYETAWPFQLERILQPIFEQAGFGFELRQRAVGDWFGAPFSMGCMHNRAGSDVDAVSWEWGMLFEHECVVEGFIREAYGLNGNEHPPVIMSIESTQINMEPFHRGKHEPLEQPGLGRKMTEIRQATLSTEVQAYLPSMTLHAPEWYLTDEFVSKEELRAFDQMLKSKPSLLQKRKKKKFRVVSRNWTEADRIRSIALASSDAYGALTGHYSPSKELKDEFLSAATAIFKNEAPIPYLIKKQAMDKFVQAGFGYEAFFTSAGFDNVPSDWHSWYLAREKAFSMGAYPGPLGHLLIATQLAHFILQQAQLAFDEGSTAANVGEVPAVPAPGKCGAGVPRSCATGMLPRNGMDIKDIVTQDDVRFVERNPSRDQTKYSFEWDQRRPLVLTIGKPVRLEVEAQQKGDVAVVCMSPCLQHCAEHKGLINVGSSRFWPPRRKGAVADSVKPPVSDVRYKLDQKVVGNAELFDMNEKVFGPSGTYCAGCEHVSEVCQAVAQLEGKHVLSLEVNPSTDPGDKEMYVEILQVMVVPGSTSKVNVSSASS